MTRPNYFEGEISQGAKNIKFVIAFLLFLTPVAIGLCSIGFVGKEQADEKKRLMAECLKDKKEYECITILGK